MASKEMDTEVKEHIKRLGAEFQHGCYVSKTPKGWCCMFGGNGQHSYVRLVSGSQILAREAMRDRCQIVLPRTHTHTCRLPPICGLPAVGEEPAK